MNILICDDEVRYIEDIEINVKNYFNEKGQKKYALNALRMGRGRLMIISVNMI